MLDACAAPGGKACHLAELGASVLATDISQERLTKVIANRDRLQLSMDIETHDARDCGHSDAEFDGILMDLGCSSMQLDEAGRGFRYDINAPHGLHPQCGSSC